MQQEDTQKKSPKISELNNIRRVKLRFEIEENPEISLNPEIIQRFFFSLSLLVVAYKAQVTK